MYGVTNKPNSVHQNSIQPFRHGNDSPSANAARLVKLMELYNKIIGLFDHRANVHVLSLRGQDPIADDAARIDLLLKH